MTHDIRTLLEHIDTISNSTVAEDGSTVPAIRISAGNASIGTSNAYDFALSKIQELLQAIVESDPAPAGYESEDRRSVQSLMSALAAGQPVTIQKLDVEPDTGDDEDFV